MTLTRNLLLNIIAVLVLLFIIGVSIVSYNHSEPSTSMDPSIKENMNLYPSQK